MDTLTPAQRSERMRRVRSKNTSPEWVVRRLVHRLGVRYRLHARDIPGRPDLVVRSRKLAIFVHGCFWHQHDDPACALSRKPKSRQEFWSAKFAANVDRDARVQAQLEEMGWQTLVIWECQLKKPDALVARLKEFFGR